MVSGSMQLTDDKQYSISAMYSQLPWDSPYDKDGNLVPHRYGGWVNRTSTNYLRDLQWNHGSAKNFEFMGNLDFDARITPWLTFSSVNNFKYIGATSHGYETLVVVVEKAYKDVSLSIGANLSEGTLTKSY